MTLPDELLEAVRGLSGDLLLLALDVDGVLAPIAATPDAARVLPQSAALLPDLATRPGLRLALVSGRPLADLRSLVRPPAGTFLVGSHGAERQDPAGPATRATVDAAALARARDLVTRIVARTPGALREDKPTGVVLHTRGAGTADAARATAEATAGLGDGVHVRLGKEVVELSAVAADKGSAVQVLRADLGAPVVLYVGDDVTDEDVFATLGPGDVGVKVGPEPTRAPYRVADPEAVTELLRAVLASRGG